MHSKYDEEDIGELCEKLPHVVVAAMVVGDQIGAVARALNRLGNGDGVSTFGAIEALGMALCGQGSVTGTSLAERVSDAVHELAHAVERIAEAAEASK